MWLFYFKQLSLMLWCDELLAFFLLSSFTSKLCSAALILFTFWNQKEHKGYHSYIVSCVTRPFIQLRFAWAWDLIKRERRRVQAMSNERSSIKSSISCFRHDSWQLWSHLMFNLLSCKISPDSNSNCDFFSALMLSEGTRKTIKK